MQIKCTEFLLDRSIELFTSVCKLFNNVLTTHVLHFRIKINALLSFEAIYVKSAF